MIKVDSLVEVVVTSCKMKLKKENPKLFSELNRIKSDLKHI